MDEIEHISTEDIRYRLAKLYGRRCPYRRAVIPYGVDLGYHGECPACVRDAAMQGGFDD